MTQIVYALIESVDEDLTDKIIPDAKSFGIEKIFGISKGIKNDIEAINSVDKMVEKSKHAEIDSKFNAKFYPHLPKEFTFNHDHELADGFYADKLEMVEAQRMIKRVNFLDDDGETIGQFSVCARGSANIIEAMMTNNDVDDRHLTHETVSNPLTLH